MEKLIRRPKGRNKFSGKVTIEPSEMLEIEVGVTRLLVLNNEGGDQPVIASTIIQQWMIDLAEKKFGDAGEYILMPYAKKFKPAGAA